jgi:hypothetical protein
MFPKVNSWRDAGIHLDGKIIKKRQNSDTSTIPAHA